MWQAGYKQACAVTTFKSHISNMMIGVTEVSIITIYVFKYKFSRIETHAAFWCVK
jgi:ribosomal protein L6P/L9E